MHMLSHHVALQLSALNERAYTVQGKQRGNLNSIDIQVGPGDYTVALKQPVIAEGFFAQNCGLFSLQGIVEPLSLMSAGANSGEIPQRGISESCQATAGAGDVLPPKIYGSKG
jgi:hypothetical protein